MVFICIRPVIYLVFEIVNLYFIERIRDLKLIFELDSSIFGFKDTLIFKLLIQ